MKSLFTKLIIALFVIVLSDCASVRMVPLYRAFLSGAGNEDRMLLYKDSDIVTEERIAKVKRSFSYKFAERMTLRDGLKKRWNKKIVDLSEYLVETDQSNARIPPASLFKDFTIETITIDDSICYYITPPSSTETKENDKVIFYSHGGGFIYEMHPMLWVFAESIARETSMPICIPIYPIYPSIDSEKLMQIMIAFYMEMLSRYPERSIIALGDSAGSDLSLSFFHYLSQNKRYALPFPKKLILISPAMVVGNDDSVIAEMEKIEVHDSMLSIRMLKTLPALFKFPEGELNYWTAPLYGDFSDFPPMYVFSGTFDIFYPQVKPFVERVRSQGKFIEFYTGVEMMHNWPVLPAIPECELAFKEIVRIIKSPDI
jgi:acetyl esterase/lipase